MSRSVALFCVFGVVLCFLISPCMPLVKDAEMRRFWSNVERDGCYYVFRERMTNGGHKIVRRVKPDWSLSGVTEVTDVTGGVICRILYERNEIVAAVGRCDSIDPTGDDIVEFERLAAQVRERDMATAGRRKR
jgi:hypothetical protein